MRRSSWTRACALLLLLVQANAWSHTKSETHSVWQIAGREVAVTISIPLVETGRLAQGDEQQPPDERVLSYLQRHTSVYSGDAQCVDAAARALAASAQFRRFEMRFSCPRASEIRLHSSAFFDLVPSHVNFAQIQTDDGRFLEQLFSRERQDIGVGGDTSLRQASVLDYLRLGILHILSGPDHLSFVLGLVLISRRLRDLVYVVSGFTIGHSVTLALAVTGLLRPHAEYIDALVGLTIAVIGAENIALSAQRPKTVAFDVGSTLAAMAAASLLGIGTLPPLLLFGAALFCANYLMLSGHLQDAARLRLLATFVFGLIHGFGFAAALLDMRLPAAKLAQILVGFNLGVELGQLSVVVLLLAVAGLLARARLALPRPLVVDGVAAALVAVGTYWFVSRSYG